MVEKTSKPAGVARRVLDVPAAAIPMAGEAPAPAETIQELEAVTDAAVIEGSMAMNETINTAETTAQSFATGAGDKMQAFFGGASERAKGAYEKGLKMTEEFTAFQKGNMEALVESGKLAAKGAESMGQEAADYARKSFESSTAAFRTFASAKSPTELFKLQSDYMKSSFEAAVAESTKVTEAWLKLAGEIAQPLSNRMAVAVEKVKANAAF